MDATPRSRRRIGAWLKRFEIADGESSLWPAAAAITAACLWATMPVRFIAGLGGFVSVTRWVVPVVTAVIVIPLVWVVVKHPLVGSFDPIVASLGRRRAVIAVIALIVTANTISIVLLVHLIVTGSKVDAHELIRAAIHMWSTNVLVYGLWFWQLDAGGPVARLELPDAPRDFLFPQMESPQFAEPGWAPQFLDYLYLSFTNSVAFSPTDALPLKRWPKMLMGVEAVMSLLLLVMVAARAVNVLQ